MKSQRRHSSLTVKLKKKTTFKEINRRQLLCYNDGKVKTLKLIKAFSEPTGLRAQTLTPVSVVFSWLGALLLPPPNPPQDVMLDASPSHIVPYYNPIPTEVTNLNNLPSPILILVWKETPSRASLRSKCSCTSEELCPYSDRAKIGTRPKNRWSGWSRLNFRAVRMRMRLLTRTGTLTTQAIVSICFVQEHNTSTPVRLEL